MNLIKIIKICPILVIFCFIFLCKRNILPRRQKSAKNEEEFELQIAADFAKIYFNQVIFVILQIFMQKIV